MYTVPAKLPVQAKKLIESFEKGEIRKASDEADEPDHHRSEKYVNEQALPGTTKKRMLELERKNLETEKETRSERLSSTTRKLSEEMFGEFASDRLKKGEGPWPYGRARNGSADETQASDGVEVFLVERQEDASVETPGEKSKTDAVLVVSYAGQSPSFIDRKLIKVLANTIQESGRKLLMTNLNLSNAHAISYVEERQKLREADLVIVHFRSVFRTLPAKLMEWLENVLVEKFAYDENEGKTFDNGLLKGKRALLLVTMSEERTAFTENSFHGDLSRYLWPIQNGILRFVGMSVLAPHLIFGARKDSSSSDDRLEEETWTLRKRLDDIWHETPLF